MSDHNQTEKQVVLVTGGAGYIGSHTCIELLQSGYKVVVVDCMDNAAEESLRRVQRITNCAAEDLVLEQVDLLDYDKLSGVFEKHGKFCSCIHFAGLKAVGESVQLPLHYYMNNLTGTLNLLNLLDQNDCFSFVFSSSATVYGDPEKVPIDESQRIHPTNPYGQTKAMIEQILADVDKSSGGKWSIALLRYFNPIGAHKSGLIGEDPKGFPNNLLPFVCQVAVGKREKLSVFGDDWGTRDGTGVRDYIHVVDLAKGHVAAVKYVTGSTPVGTEAFNIGTGNGISVLELVAAFGKACGKDIPYVIAPRRSGDIATCYADASKAKRVLGWEAVQSGVDRMCEDAWRWQSGNPDGYAEPNDGKPKQRKCVVFDIYKKK